MCAGSPQPPMMMSPRRATASSSSARNQLRKVKSERWSPFTTSPLTDSFPSQLQFKPMRQILDERAARRIRRNGLGEEVEKWEKGRKEAARRGKDEISTLKTEIEELKQQKSTLTMQSVIDLDLFPSFADEAVTSAIRSPDPVQPDDTTVQVPATIIDDDNATVPFSDVDLNHSGFRGIPDSFDDPTGSEASTVLAESIVGHTPLEPQASQLKWLERDIEINKEHHERLIAKLEQYLPDECDPSDFEAIDAALDTALTTLTMAESYANDSWAAFEILDNEIKELGFPGEDAQEMLEELKHRFRKARLELEYTNPGETPFGFDNQKLLDRMMAKVRELKKCIDMERQESLSREAQLETYGTRLRKRLDAAQGALRAVAKEDAQKETSISRLQIALNSYRGEVVCLEQLIEEIDNRHHLEVKDLQGRLRREQSRTRDSEADIRQMREEIGNMQASLKQANATIAALQASKITLEMLVKKQKAAQTGDVETMQAEIRILLSKVNHLRAKQVLNDKISIEKLCTDLPTPPASSAPGTPTFERARPMRRRYDSGFGILPEVEGEDEDLDLIL